LNETGVPTVHGGALWHRMVVNRIVNSVDSRQMLEQMEYV
jgi:hypothetical protein